MKFKTKDIKAFLDTIPNDWYIEDWDEESEKELLNMDDLDKLAEIDIPRSFVWICYQGDKGLCCEPPDSKEFTYALKKWIKENK